MTEAISRAIQRDLFRALKDRPLDLNDPGDQALYVSLYPQHRDPVVRLFDNIDFSEGASLQLVAGFRGTGKTTEFSRLEKGLWREGYLVVRIDLDQYLDMTASLDVSSFLLILAGAISDRVSQDKLLGQAMGGVGSFWARARTFLQKEVVVDDVLLDVEVARLKVGLRGDPSIRQRVRDAMRGQLTSLVAEVHGFHQAVVDALRERHPGHRGLVVVLDSLEHLRGSEESVAVVHRSLEELFYRHLAHLRLPQTHLVMSVPAFLHLNAGFEAEVARGAMQAWPACPVLDRNGKVDPDMMSRLVALVKHRVDWRLLLPDEAALERLIVQSGGYLRDLLSMLVEAVHLARYGVGADMVERVVSEMRRAYLPIYAEERAVLRKVATHRDLSRVSKAERPYVIDFLDSHLVLCYLDRDYWYDVHPLVRELVLDNRPDPPT